MSSNRLAVAAVALIVVLPSFAEDREPEIRIEPKDVAVSSSETGNVCRLVAAAAASRAARKKRAASVASLTDQDIVRSSTWSYTTTSNKGPAEAANSDEPELAPRPAPAVAADRKPAVDPRIKPIEDEIASLKEQREYLMSQFEEEYPDSPTGGEGGIEVQIAEIDTKIADLEKKLASIR